MQKKAPALGNRDLWSLPSLPVPKRQEADSAYTASLNLKVKVLDFIKSGGPILTIDRTVFELWLGTL